jgi:hypothetical protein
VDYKEFLPLMVELIGAMKAKATANAARAEVGPGGCCSPLHPAHLTLRI